MILTIGIILILLFVILLNTRNNQVNVKKGLSREEININLKNYTKEYLFSVAGVHLENYKYPVFNICKELDLVILKPEPDNKFDSDAIKVEVSGWQIGYVPAGETAKIHSILAKEYICYIESKNILDFVNVEVKIRYKN